VITAAFAWNNVQVARRRARNLGPYLWGGLIGGLVFAVATIFKQTGPRSPRRSMRCSKAVPGRHLRDVRRTLRRHRAAGGDADGGTLFALLFAYRSGLIRATENFKLGVVAATAAIALIYLATMVLGMFGIRMPYIHESGLIGIGFSLVVVVIAALNLVLDFDFIESGVEQGAPKYMEWYGAFGLMVTLVWLYLEFLRLLSKLQSR
jgi:uncharacterized YccA/Bax inhibitor family protein